MTSSSMIKLPKIEQRGESRHDEEPKRAMSHKTLDMKKDIISPFRLPSDDEVFVFREAERQKKNEIKKMSESLKIWEKKTATSRNPLKHFKNFGEPTQEKYDLESKHAYNSKDKKLIDTAIEVIKEREKYKDTANKKEGIIELVEQKKEVFLVEMTVDIIQKEIGRIKKIISEKSDALTKSEKMLDQDWDEFEKYSESNKKAYEEAENRANQEVERRKTKEQEYKQINQKLTALKAEKTRNEELSIKYKEDKAFLDSLAPKEFWDQMKAEKEARIKELRDEFVEKEIQKLENQEDTESIITSVGQNTKSVKGMGLAGKRAQLRAQLEEKFQKMIDNKEIDEIEEFEDNYKMYFTEPNQLIDLFARLEERNLFLIQMMQEAEHNYEELKNQFNKKKAITGAQIAALKENKAQLEKQIAESEAKLKLLNRSGATKTKMSEEERLPDMLRKKIFEFYKSVKNEIGNTVEFTVDHTVPILKTIEAHVDQLLNELKLFDKKIVAAKRKSFEDGRKKKQRNAQADLVKELSKEKRERMLLRMREAPKVNKGRRDMVKSTPYEEKQEEEAKDDNDEEEKEQKYFKPYLNEY